MDGLLSESEEDSVYLDLKGIDLKYVFDVADLGVNLSGFATGPAVASCVMKEPKLNADLFIQSIGFENGYLGDAQAHLEWHHPVKGLYIDIDITIRPTEEGDVATANPGSVGETTVTDEDFFHDMKKRSRKFTKEIITIEQETHEEPVYGEKTGEPGETEDSCDTGDDTGSAPPPAPEEERKTERCSAG